MDSSDYSSDYRLIIPFITPILTIIIPTARLCTIDQSFSLEYDSYLQLPCEVVSCFHFKLVFSGLNWNHKKLPRGIQSLSIVVDASSASTRSQPAIHCSPYLSIQNLIEGLRISGPVTHTLQSHDPNLSALQSQFPNLSSQITLSSQKKMKRFLARLDRDSKSDEIFLGKLVV